MSFYQITEGKTYRQLTAEEKALIQERQTELVTLIQDGSQEVVKELVDSFKGLIKGMAYRQAEKSFTIEQDDFEGIMYEVLWKSVLTFDRSLGIPFTPVFIMNVRNAVKMLYRAKSYDVHETTHEVTNRLDSPLPEDATCTMADALEVGTSFESLIESQATINTVLDELFGKNDKKKTIVHMYLDGFKRNEIVTAVSEGKVTDGLIRLVNRTVAKFKQTYIASV
jgi:DNA-directed RNA polymerase specialized sigma subunit